MTQIQGAMEKGGLAALSEAARQLPICFDPQYVINHDARTRPWNHLPSFPRTAFNPERLASYEAITRSRILEAIRNQPALTQPRRANVCSKELEALFGDFHPGHAFHALRPDWGIRLTEPMATRGLAHLLGRGAGKLKAERIRAFLEALRIQDIPKDNRSLEHAGVYSEKHRIDLEVRFQADDGARRVVLVEAKFGHKLTKGQLSTYYTARQGYDRDCRIVGLTSDAGEGMHHKQVANWSVVLWRDLWRRFEKNRPHEADGQLAAFMAWLWQRIGGLSPSNSNSRSLVSQRKVE